MAAAVETQKTFTSEVEEDTFRWFNYNITSMFCEYLNDVEKHSYDKLTDAWWLALFRELDIISKLEDDSKEIRQQIIEKVLAEFDAGFLTKEQTEELSKNLSACYEGFIAVVVGPIHYCRIPGCDGDCGIQPCGVCIDCCRCPMYW